MKEKDKSTIYKRLLKSRIFFIFLIPIFVALLFGISQQFYYRYQVQKKINEFNAEVANYKKQREDLTKLIEYYQDPSNLENEARIRLNLKKEGEKVVIILPTATSTGGNQTSGSDENLPNYKKWWYYFFGK